MTSYSEIIFSGVSAKVNKPKDSGNQEVWPVYLTLGNISKEIRCAGQDGVDMTCPDQQVRRMHPIVAAYIADFPEQCLVACCMENWCPKCTVGRDHRGDMRPSASRKRDSMVKNLWLHSWGELSGEIFESELGLQAIHAPFWATLLHNDIFQCMTPDILHQLHKGVFKDHIVSWCMDIIGKDALDAWFKELQHVFLGVIAGGVENRVIAAVHAVLDFVYYAQFQSHTEKTLSHMQAALTSFYANKDMFIELGVREHFNIPKIHSMIHYAESIHLFGSADGFNTKLPEQLHIDFAKRAYCATISNLDSDSPSDPGTPELFNVMPRQIHRFTMLMATRGYYLPKTCHFPNTPIQRLIDHHGASLFIPALKSFIREHAPTIQSHGNLNLQECIDVYKYIMVLLPARPHVSNSKCFFKVCASPVVASKDPRKPLVPARFDTALFIEERALYNGKGISGLRVGEIKAIFTLPSCFGTFPHPLLYIHWFRPLQTFDNDL
ncbi:uncharacterized protein HD556DRAFT_1312038 [Suillus plorans]|uniref:Uncharacterized protein n=1 Tax=Suillus plorans TaxID=116603 RepID=A0A9P7DDJ1_9AGAM|nr:uncharacterized protein HD556DRAFT_1312038 [Suillus plorans]KAG1788448.1 hypothetical protein HD556DRAFT_1312038 [Suillus plorans]